MNTGAFGEGFPYSNFHDLNMDWIIKIAKDFLDQYTHIQEIIETGKTDIQNLTDSGLEQLQNLTDSGLEQLQNKADALEELLQAWYNEHSEDIANQLAEALADLNEWYTTHQNYLDQTLADNISAFDTHAEQKAEQTIASIPDDYTALSAKVTDLIYQNGIILPNGYYVNGRTILTNEIQAGDVIFYSFDAYENRYGFLSFRDSSDTQIGSIGKGTATSGATHYEGLYTIPANYDHVTVEATGKTGLTVQVISTPLSNRSLYNFVDSIIIEENSVWG